MQNTNSFLWGANPGESGQEGLPQFLMQKVPFVLLGQLTQSVVFEYKPNYRHAKSFVYPATFILLRPLLFVFLTLENKKTSPSSARVAAMRSMQNNIAKQNFIKHS